MRTVGFISDQSAAMERRTGTDPIRNRSSSAHRERSAHAVAHRSHFLLLVDGRLLLEPGDERFRVRVRSVLVQCASELHERGTYSRILKARTFSSGRCLLRPIERI